MKQTMYHLFLCYDKDVSLLYYVYKLLVQDMRFLVTDITVILYYKSNDICTVGYIRQNMMIRSVVRSYLLIDFRLKTPVYSRSAYICTPWCAISK